MIKRIIISIVVIIGLSFVIERALSYLGFGFTMLENVVVLLAVGCLVLLNEIRYFKNKNNSLQLEIEDMKVAQTEEIAGLKKMFSSEQERCRKDRAVYDRLIKVLPPDGSISFLRKGSYLITLFEPEKQLKDFMEFERIYKDDPLAFYFENNDIQRHNIAMTNALHVALAKVNDCLFEKQNDGYYAFNLNLKPADGYGDVVEEVSDLVGVFLEKYDELRMAVREDLGCTWI